MRKVPRRRYLIWGSAAAALLVTGALTWFFVAARISGAIVVPRDFPTIQSALEHAAPGARIIVRANGGPYQGKLVIQTPDVSIVAAGGRAVITCSGTKTGVTIGARGVTLRGFEVRSCDVGIQLKLASSVTLDDIVITEARIGIRLGESDGNVLRSISVRNGEIGIAMTSANRNMLHRIRIDAVTNVGIRLSSAWSNTIEHATVNGARIGISLEDDSEENRIASFVGNECSTSGVEILNSSSNAVTTSLLADCGVGITLNAAADNTIERNRIQNSVKQGISLYKSQQNMISLNTVSDGCKDGISLFESSDNSLVCNSVIGCSETGIMLESVRSSLLLGNKIDKNAIGIQCQKGAGNRVLRNRLSGNALAGIILSEGTANLFLDNSVAGSSYGIALIGSTRNQLLRNGVAACSADGISILNHADQNTIQDNTIEKNRTGVLVAASSQSTITDNRIRGCAVAVRLFQSGTGTKVEGNSIRDNSIGIEIASRLNEDRTILHDTATELLPGDTRFHLVLANNTFVHNTSYDISNLTDKTVYAAGNYWDGRSKGGRVQGKVVLPRSSWKGTIAIGATDSLDQIIIARLLQLALIADGVKVIDLIGLGDTGMVKAALLAGDVDLALADPSGVDTKELAERGIAVSPPLAVENRLSLVVSSDIADSLPGDKISDLAAYLSSGGATLKLAVPKSIPSTLVRTLASVYGLPITGDSVVWTGDIAETETLLKLGTVNAGIVHSLEETVTLMGFRALEDERGVFHVSHTAFLAPRRVIAALPEVGAVEQQLRSLLTTDNVHSLVSKVRLLGSEPREVAQEFLLQHGLIER